MKLIKLVLLLLIISPLSAAQPEPPYLYYYSRMLGGIIIERADGTDSRIIGQDVIPAGLPGIRGPGWSPSGKYFAAMGLDWGENWVPAKAYIIDPSGANQNDWIQHATNAAMYMEWSPQGKDWLVIVDAASHYSLHYTIWLVDVETGDLLAVFSSEAGERVDQLYPLTIDWKSEPEGVSLMFNASSTALIQHFRVVMLSDGTVRKVLITADEYKQTRPKTFIETPRNTSSPSGRYKLWEESTKYLIDLQTEMEIELPSHSAEIAPACRHARWDSSEYYMIILVGTEIGGSGCGLDGVGITDVSGQLWREIGYCVSYENCINWLPLQVKINDLPTGQAKPVQIDPVAFETAEVHGGSLYYVTDTRLKCNQASANGEPNRVIEDGDGEILFSLYSSKPCSYGYYMDKLENGIYIVEAYDPVNTLLATVVQRGHIEGVWIWSLEDGVGKQINQLNTNAYMLEFTEDGEYLRVRDLNQWKIYSVEDILRTATSETPSGN
jgi:hypothetical protein